jgi:hypothetical protein
MVHADAMTKTQPRQRRLAGKVVAHRAGAGPASALRSWMDEVLRSEA